MPIESKCTPLIQRQREVVRPKAIIAEQAAAT